MTRKPNPLLTEFFDKSIPLPTIDWETVPLGVKPADAWEAYDEGVEGWVPLWFPSGDYKTGISYNEFERAYMFNENLVRILKAMNRWPLWGSPAQKKKAAAFALLQLYCEVNALCPKV